MSESETPRLAPDEVLLSEIESVLLVAGGPVSIDSLSAALEAPKSRIRGLLAELVTVRTSGIRVQMQDERAQLVTAPENVAAVQRFLGAAKPAPLSRQALEVLTIIAYHQPVTRAEIEAMRGINSDRAVQTLLARDLIEEGDHRPTIGRPMEYRTSFGFLEYFGLTSLDELPPLESRGEGELARSELGMRQRETGGE